MPRQALTEFAGRNLVVQLDVWHVGLDNWLVTAAVVDVGGLRHGSLLRRLGHRVLGQLALELLQHLREELVLAVLLRQ